MKKGLTLIELVLVVIILGIAIPPLLGLFFNLARKAVQAEAISTATFYAEKEMERLISIRNYSSLSITNNTSCVTALPSGYSCSYTLKYAVLSGNNWTDTTNNTTGYKRLRVSVSRNDGIIPVVTLESIIGDWLYIP